MKKVSALRVLLVGNYPNDRQESMQRFAALLQESLTERGIAVSTIRPLPVFGRIWSSSHGLGKWLGYIDKFLLFPWALRRQVRAIAAQGGIVHVVDQANAVYYNHIRTVPHMLTCHDLLAVRAALGEFPSVSTGFAGRVYQRWILNSLKRFSLICADSAKTKADIIRLTSLNNETVTVVPISLNHPYAVIQPELALGAVESLFQSRGFGSLIESLRARRFIFHIGGNQWYKNRLGVLRIYAELNAKLKSAPLLVMAGAPFIPEMRSSCLKQGHSGAKVVELGKVTNAELNALYSAACLLLFPSLEEGYGWPILEAQACGCLVVTTEKAPMTELGGEGAVYLPPMPVTTDTTQLANWSSKAAKIVQQAVELPAEIQQKRLDQACAHATRASRNKMIDAYVAAYMLVSANSTGARANS